MRASRSSSLHIRLLGRVEVATASGRPVRLTNRHAQALLALLVLSGRPRARDAIAADLWPDADGASPSALRQALWLLRAALSAAGARPDQVLELDADTLALRPAGVVRLDATEFETLARDDRTAENAVRCYTGDLVEGLGHECFAAERERLSDLYEDALAVAASLQLADGRLEVARATAERLLARDPLREESHATLITVHGLTGSRSQVVRRYRRLRTLLARELDVLPLPETEAAYRAALACTVARSGAALRTPDVPPRGLVAVSA